MSLYKQLWLAILFLMGLAFTGSLVVSSMSARHYLQEQLSLKNIDNANSLALTIANAAVDDVTTELMITAQFDTGHYQYIRLLDINGNILIEHLDNNTAVSTPTWFSRLLKLNSQEGVAQIQRGWQQIGTLTLKSHDVFAYHALWSSSVRLFNYCLAIAVLSGLVGTILLKVILRPLAATVAQAKAISKRQFVVVKEPRTQEFCDLVRSMNSLSLHVRNMMEEESGRLSRLQQAVLFDDVTNLPNREHFLNILEACLDCDESRSSGIIVLVRLKDLTELNRTHGRQLIDLLLSRIGSSLLEQTKEEASWQVGRLNGADFALLAPGEHEPQLVAHKVQEIISATISEAALQANINLPTAASIYHPGENISQLLSKTDAALASAEQTGDSAVEIADDNAPEITKIGIDKWKLLLGDAFEQQHISLVQYPVINKHHSLLHMECPARLTLSDGTIMNGGQFIPWINRFDLGITLDEAVIDLVLKELSHTDSHLCVNLSARAISSEKFLNNLANKLSQHMDYAQRLSMEIPEHSVYQHLEGFKRFCHVIKPLGCHIGIEHVGHQISQIGEIHDLGLDYIKIDASICRHIESTPAHKVLLRGLCMIVHSVGVIAIAEGVQQQEQWETLQQLGVDGATGPLVTALSTHTQ